VTGSREEYAGFRRQEAIAALKLAGIPAYRSLCLGAVDQDAVFELPRLIEDFCIVLNWFRPEFVITHAYEGGHPDHDCAALVAGVAAGLHQSSGAVELFEIPLYHARAGECTKGEFLPESGSIENSAELRLLLTLEEHARKQAMIACYPSQRRVLQGFPLETERLRPAPVYDFAMPPHEGKLWYECLQWPMTGAWWRDLASEALTRFHASVCG
jgi:LmbE family N-acetylglucosaminyl deacetylase